MKEILRKQTKIKATDTRNFQKIVTMATRAGHWRVLDMLPVSEGQKLIPQVNQLG
jgi:hypothetical protein